MPLEIPNQSIEQFNKASNILVLLPPNANGDSVAAALALRSFLRKLEKEVSVAAPTLPESKFSFLEGFEDISTTINVNKNFLIELSTTRAQVDELSYKKETDRLLIYIKPKNGEFRETDVSLNTADYPYNLIVTVGIGSLDQLNDLYTKNAEMFFQTTIINLDYKAANESFGQVNIIDLGATSVSEVVMDLINKYESSLMDENIATSLLAGIISETNSFQHTRTTPQTFIRASQLVSLGAKQQEIVSRLFKTKSLGFLKLWGRALARLNQDQEAGIVHTALTQNDFIKSGADLAEVDLIISEMTNQLKLARLYLMFFELSTSQTAVYCQLPSTIDPQVIFGGLDSGYISPQIIKVVLDQPVQVAEERILAAAKKELSDLAS